MWGRTEEIIRKLGQGISIHHYETVRVRKDGSKVVVSLSISPVKDSEGKIIGAAKVARDITERRAFEQRKDEFISIASHELKTPLTSIKGFTQLLQRRFQHRDDEEALHLLTRIDAQLGKLTQLISELLDISKIQSGQLDYRDEVFDLGVLVQEIVETVQVTVQTHRLVVETQAQAEAFGDRDCIGQVFMNLLTNAIKYSPQTDTVVVRVVTDTKQGKAIVSVQDFGLGIAQDHQQKVFERFYRVRDQKKQTFTGLGLGLYISYEIVKRHGGQITVESEEGKGSTFSVALPLQSSRCTFNLPCPS